VGGTRRGASPTENVSFHEYLTVSFCLDVCFGHSALDAESLSKADFTREIAGQARYDETKPALNLIQGGFTYLAHEPIFIKEEMHYEFCNI